MGAVVDKGAVALGDKEEALDVGGGVACKVVFQSGDGGGGREVSNPEGVARLFGFARRTAGERGNGGWGGLVIRVVVWLWLLLLLVIRVVVVW